MYNKLYTFYEQIAEELDDEESDVDYTGFTGYAFENLTHAENNHLLFKVFRFKNCRFRNCEIFEALISRIDFENCTFENCDFRNVIFEKCTFENTKFINCVGIGDKKSEIEFASTLLNIIENREGELEMNRWHTCSTVHCIAGWWDYMKNHDAEKPMIDLAKVSSNILTLSQYFYVDEQTAIAALKRIASGKESVFV